MMLSAPQLALLWLLLVIFTACDLVWRRIPILVTLGGLALALLAPWPIGWDFWFGLLFGAVLTMLAGFPGGDWKAAAVLGAVTGPGPISAALALAFCLSLLRWRMRKRLRPEPWMVILFIAFLPILAAGIWRLMLE